MPNRLVGGANEYIDELLLPYGVDGEDIDERHEIRGRTDRCHGWFQSDEFRPDPRNINAGEFQPGAKPMLRRPPATSSNANAPDPAMLYLVSVTAGSIR
jgi:hypothetical protein